jgi:hypothetical protein
MIQSIFDQKEVRSFLPLKPKHPDIPCVTMNSNQPELPQPAQNNDDSGIRSSSSNSVVNDNHNNTPQTLTPTKQTAVGDVGVVNGPKINSSNDSVGDTLSLLSSMQSPPPPPQSPPPTKDESNHTAMKVDSPPALIRNFTARTPPDHKPKQTTTTETNNKNDDDGDGNDDVVDDSEAVTPLLMDVPLPHQQQQQQIPTQTPLKGIRDDDDNGNNGFYDDDETATQPETPEKADDALFFEDVEDYENSNDKSVIVIALGDDDEQGVRNNNNKRSSNSQTSNNNKNTSSSCDRKKKKTRNDKKATRSTRRNRFPCTACVACCLGPILLLAIAVLGYNLYAVRNGMEPSFFGLDVTSWFSGNNDGDESSGSSSGSTTGTNSSSSTADPELMKRIQDTLLLFGSIPGIPMEEKWSETSSTQYAVLNWLASDPNAFAYSGTKIIQRYALGCFYWSLETADTEKHVLDTWMTYADECTSWTTTHNRDDKHGVALCNESTGLVQSIHLEDVGLSGTIAPELALLSDSLGKCRNGVESLSSNVVPSFISDLPVSFLVVRIHLFNPQRCARNHTNNIRVFNSPEAGATVPE